jgi:DNA-binding MarR family transcriptional regulator
MPATTTYRRREKMFGEGRLVPLDREAKVRIKTLARALMRRTEAGRHYGVLTAKFVAVCEALVDGFHNAATGRCFPSYERIAEKADCDRSTVYNAINALERAGLLTWVHRLVRVREWGVDLFGKARNRERVVRTSNQYAFVDPQPRGKPPDSSKSKFPTGTQTQVLILPLPPAPAAQKELEGPLGDAVARLGARLRGAT